MKGVCLIVWMFISLLLVCSISNFCNIWVYKFLIRNMKYQKYKQIQPEMKECFFAFNQEQFNKGVEKHSLKDKKIYNAGHGLYGTKDGIADFLGQYEKSKTQI